MEADTNDTKQDERILCHSSIHADIQRRAVANERERIKRIVEDMRSLAALSEPVSVLVALDDLLAAIEGEHR